MDRLQSYLQCVMDDMEESWPRYAPLCPKEKTQPIPFFGDIKRARVLTVGVNPSAKEFLLKRGWPEAMTSAELKDRLQHYFQHSSPPPHKWFQTWSQALVTLGVTYQDGAAHIDLSPRATISMGNAIRDGNGKLFAGMVEQDVKWFFKLLSECSEARLLLFAGCIPGDYISEFMERIAPDHGFKFIGSRTQTGNGMTGFYDIRGLGSDRPAFFCSLSLSARKLEQRQMLIKRVEEHKEELSRRLGPHSTKDPTNSEYIRT